MFQGLPEINGGSSHDARDSTTALCTENHHGVSNSLCNGQHAMNSLPQKVTGLWLPNSWRARRGTPNETEQLRMLKFRAIIHAGHWNVR